MASMLVTAVAVGLGSGGIVHWSILVVGLRERNDSWSEL